MTLPMFDADEHYYEPDDAFTRYLPKRFIEENRAVRVIRTKDRPQGRLFFGDQKITFYGVNPVEATKEPGALLKYFKIAAGTGNASPAMSRPMTSRSCVAGSCVRSGCASMA
jgi:hypothetical protein